MPYFFQQGFSLVRFSGYGHIFQRTVGIQGNGGVEQQIWVAHRVHASVTEQAADMFFQFLTADKWTMEFVHNFPFFVCQLIRIGRIYRRKKTVFQLIFFSIGHCDGLTLEVYTV